MNLDNHLQHLQYEGTIDALRRQLQHGRDARWTLGDHVLANLLQRLVLLSLSENSKGQDSDSIPFEHTHDSEIEEIEMWE
jgi:hypothetical protein